MACLSPFLNQRGRPTTCSKAAHCPSPTGATAAQLTLSSHPRWNELRLHRMAQSITQLTLCQVTGEEIDPVMSSCCYLVQVTQVMLSFCSQSNSDALTRMSRYLMFSGRLLRWSWYWLAMAGGQAHDGASLRTIFPFGCCFLVLDSYWRASPTW